MKHRVKNTLRGLAKHFGLKVKYVDYFGEETHGKLFVHEKRILINARKPRTEHIFTLLHEIGHYVLHVLNPYRKFHPRFFDAHWKINFMATLSSKVRRYMRFNFRKESGREWEADMWALCAFWLLARRFGARKELVDFLKRHPEKWSKFFLVRIVANYQDGRTWIRSLLKRFQLPFKSS
jgi:hypothetical protein